MPATTSVTLLPTTAFGSASGNYDGSATAFNSDKVKGDGYYGFSDGVHTIQTRVTSLVGTIKIQGTLVKDPLYLLYRAQLHRKRSIFAGPGRMTG